MRIKIYKAPARFLAQYYHMAVKSGISAECFMRWTAGCMLF